MQNTTNNQLVVLGMHRSGTSALMGVLEMLGIHTGDSLMPGTEFNPKGYFESAALVREHEALLAALDYNWYDERPLPVNWTCSPATDTARGRLKELFYTEFAGVVDNWAIKDPRMCRLLPVWKEIFAEAGVEPGYILMLRAPEEVAASLMRRNGIPLNKAALLYVVYLLDAELNSREHRRVAVDFQDLLQDATGDLARIQQALGIALPALTDEVVNHIQAFLSPELKHFNAGELSPDAMVGEPLRLARAVYGQLKNGLDETTAASFDALRVDFERCLASLEPWLSTSHIVDVLAREVLVPGRAIEEAACRDATSVLYFDIEGGGGYTEAQTLSQQWCFGASRNTLRFEFSAGVGRIRSLRLDITDRPAFCELFGVWIDNPQGDRVWQWQEDMPLFEHSSADMRLVQSKGEATGLWVASVGFDPHAALIVPDAILARLGEGWAVGVEFSAALTSAAFPKLLDVIELQTKKSANMLDSLQARERDAVALTGELSHLRAQLDHCRTDILRAEAQISLLKDIWLSDESGLLESV